VSERADVWSGRVGFILAAVGSAVGIGSIWKFPYEVGSNGGGAFLLFYVAGLVVIVVPLMFAEFAIGRHGRADSAGSIAAVAAAHGADRRWGWAGLLGVLTGALILSFYSVIGGWTIGYALQTAVNGLPGVDPSGVRARYEAFLASPPLLLLYHAVFMSLAAAIVARGVTKGIEAASKVLMPLLVALMVALAVYSIGHGDLAATLRFLLRVDPAHLTARAALEALGLGFFSIGVGMGVMITYAAYAGPGIDLRQVAIVSVMVDGAISLLAGLAVFPIVFAHGLDPATGPGLVFVTLPLAFARMPFGAVAAQAFFGLLFVAALASAISMLELVVALLMRRLAWPRAAATAMASGTCFLVGITTVLSFNVWAGWYPLARLEMFRTATVFELLDHVTSNVLLPVGGLAIALFAGWAMPPRVLAETLALGPAGTAALSVTLRYVVPAAIAAVTLASIFV
jgi:NSS family neurotransmitter:Na+ symporter